MRVDKLKLTTFRNIDFADLNITGANIVALYGQNGAGKTNLLEALSLLSPGQGIHRAKRDDQTQAGAPSWGLHATLTTHDKPRTAGMLYEKGKRTLKIDDDVADTQNALSDLGNVLWFTPKMDRLFVDGAVARREFLDRLVFGHDPYHARHLARYKHHLKARLKLLKQNAHADWIDVEESEAAKYAAIVTEARLNYLQALKEHLPEVALSLTGGIERLMRENDDPSDAIKQSFVENRMRDTMYGANSFGPGRSELTGLIKQNNIALNNASTGQHKRAILHILLANARLMHAQTGQPPMLLMDEVTSHLDEATRHHIFGELTAMGTQIWLTGTEKELFDGLDEPAYIHVTQGTFKKED